MAVPDFQQLTLPLMEFANKKGGEISIPDGVEFLGNFFSLSDAEKKQVLPSGIQTTLANRVGWAITYLKKAGLLESTRRGFSKITLRGKTFLDSKPDKINIKILTQFPEFLDFQNRKKTRKSEKNSEPMLETQEFTDNTPLESLERAYQNLREGLADDLLAKLKSVNPSFFEKIVVDLLLKMGYGGSKSDAGKALGKSGDGGIDGIIKEDKLGLDVLYIQAKRWDTTSVGRPEVMQFAGALQGQRATKGIFITTSRFTEEARNYVSQIGSKIVLIDGETLADLMIDHDVGVSTITTYPLKRIDQDFFEETE